MTNLYETKMPVMLDDMPAGDVSSLNEAATDSAGGLVQQSIARFRDAVKDEITNRELSREDLNGSAALAMVSAFTKAADTKRAYVQTIAELSKYYLVDALLNLIADETLVADIMTGEIVQLQGANRAIDDELQVLQRRLNLDQICEDITLDLLKFGDYTLRLEMDDAHGVTSVADDVHQDGIVALYRHGLPEKFLIREKTRIRILSANTHLHFALGRSKIRIELGDEFGLNEKDIERIRSKLPSYVRVGRPLLYGVQSKLKELQLLEALVPASKLHQLSTGSLVGVTVPSQTDPKEAFQISRRYESLLNSKTALDKRTGGLTDVGDILATAGRTKVVPVMGEKGSLQTIDVKENRAADDMLSSIRDIRAAICSTIGVPPELLFGSEAAESKGEFLKRHARYLRKIKSIQAALASGMKQLALAHLIKRGFSVMPNDIQVVFRNEVVNIDELDKLEFADQVNTMVSTLWNFMQELDENDHFKGRIDWDALSDWMRRQMALMGSNRSFIRPANESDDSERESRRTNHSPDKLLMEAVKRLAERINEESSLAVDPRPSDEPDDDDDDDAGTTSAPSCEESAAEVTEQQTTPAAEGEAKTEESH